MFYDSCLHVLTRDREHLSPFITIQIPIYMIDSSNIIIQNRDKHMSILETDPSPVNLHLTKIVVLFKYLSYSKELMI